MSEPTVHEQLAGMTIERDAALAERDDLRLSLAAVRDHAEGMQAIVDTSRFKLPRSLCVAVADLRWLVEQFLKQGRV